MPNVEREASSRRSALQLAVLVRDTEWIHRLPIEGAVVIGRSLDSDVRLGDSMVSRRHAVLHVGREIVIECVSPTNRLLVWRAGDPIGRAPATPSWQRIDGPCTLTVGDTVRLGSSTIVVRQAPTSGLFDAAAQGETVRDVEPPQGVSDVYEPPRLRPLFVKARRVARLRLDVLILGEVGVGKSVLARAIHLGSARADRPFMSISCGSLSAELLESELFGHEQGMFQDALVARPGTLELASGGTVVLDDIDALPLPLQGRLQVALHQRKVYRVGGGTPRAVDVRVIATTQRDLDADAARGAFSRDLLDSLQGAVFVIPPLRERVDDIEPLASALLADEGAKLGDATPLTLSPEALSLLQRHPWRRNVLELRNVLRQAATECVDPVVRPEHLKLAVEDEASDQARRTPTIPPAGPMLSTATIELLYDAVIDAGMHPHDLCLGIDEEYVAGLAQRPSDALQFREMLYAMNRDGGIADGTVPLLIWLRNAIQIAGPRAMSEVFRGAHRKLAEQLSGGGPA